MAITVCRGRRISSGLFGRWRSFEDFYETNRSAFSVILRRPRRAPIALARWGPLRPSKDARPQYWGRRPSRLAPLAPQADGKLVFAAAGLLSKAIAPGPNAIT